MAKSALKNEIKGWSDEQLQDKLKDAQLQLQKVKFSHAIQPIENPMQIKVMKKDIARMHTEFTKRKESK